MTLRWSLREFSNYTAEQRVLFRARLGTDQDQGPLGSYGPGHEGSDGRERVR